MSALEQIKKTTTLSEFAILMGYKPKTLSYIIYIIENDAKYNEFIISKKGGGSRKIKAPVDELKYLQKCLARYLNKCFEEICVKDKHKDSLSHGFRKNHSIVTNANKHIRKRHVFNVDLQDFFPSINFGRVRGFFIKNHHFKLEPKVATIIAQIACHENELPQGSPCSPIISNLIGHLLDIRMVYLAKKTNCTYSRYADDLSFSTNKKEFSQKIALKKEGINNEWEPGNTLRKEILKVGFNINDGKTSLQHKTRRQVTTGLIVNEKVNIKKEYYKKARAMCNSLFQLGEFHIGVNNITEEKIAGSINQLEGILSYIYKIKGEYDDGRNISDKRYKPKGTAKLYRNFLAYKHFFSLTQPLIICEGKTDIIYLKCALMQLEETYKDLIEKDTNGFTFKINFLKFTKNFKKTFVISSGTPGLLDLMRIYDRPMKLFKGKSKMHPVIILVDEDSGSDKIKHYLKLPKDIVFKESFYYVKENLYIVPIPTVNGNKESAIEDLFEKNVLEMKIAEKSFDRGKKIDVDTKYGKIVFAEKVIKANQGTINFDKFKGLLDRFNLVIRDYSTR